MTAFLIALFIGLSFGIIAYITCKFLIWWVEVDGKDDTENDTDSRD